MSTMDIYAAGAAAAFTIDLLIYPLDTLKTRYQSQDYIKHSASSPLRKPLALRGLYQGIGSVILATVPAAGLFFSTYENTKVLFAKHANIPTPLIHSSASAVAEMASCLVLAPAEVIKQNAQMLTSSKSTSLVALREVSRHSARRLFTGYTALVARNLPFTALQFPLFEALRTHLGKDAKEKGLMRTGWTSGVSAGTAGALAAWITTPSDVVKTRMMLAASGEREGVGIVLRKIYAEKGVGGFFRGGVFRSVWTAVGSGLYLGTYDVAKVWLGRGKDGDGGL